MLRAVCGHASVCGYASVCVGRNLMTWLKRESDKITNIPNEITKFRDDSSKQIIIPITIGVDVSIIT